MIRRLRFLARVARVHLDDDCWCIPKAYRTYPTRTLAKKRGGK